MFQHVAVERVERGVVQIGHQHAFFQVVEHHHARRPAQSAKRLLVQLGPEYPPFRLEAGLPASYVPQKPERRGAIPTGKSNA